MKKLNKKQNEFCKEHSLSKEQFFGQEKIKGSLYLGSVKELPEGFNPKVGGNLWLRSVVELPGGFNPTVGGSLFLNSVIKLPKGFNPTVGGNLDLYSVKKLPKVFNPKVGGYLYLYSVKKLPKVFNPTVGGNLNLNSVVELSKGFNPTLGGYLYLKSGCSDKKKELPEGYLFSWENGKYIKADGIFTEVISKKRSVYKVKKLGSEKEFYLVTDGVRYAHGDTIKEAKADLIYKLSNRDKSKYEGLTWS